MIYSREKRKWENEVEEQSSAPLACQPGLHPAGRNKGSQAKQAEFQAGKIREGLSVEYRTNRKGKKDKEHVEPEVLWSLEVG